MKIIVPNNQKPRLRNTHFRRPRLPQAGNFVPGIGWPNLVEMFREKLDHQINLAIAADELTFSITLDAKELIGWCGTVCEQQIPREDTETFTLNKRATCRMIKRNTDHEAPLTTEVTFIIRIPKGNRVALLESLYPGQDVGKLEGDVSSREKVVFFGFTHKGEALV